MSNPNPQNVALAVSPTRGLNLVNLIGLNPGDTRDVILITDPTSKVRAHFILDPNKADGDSTLTETTRLKLAFRVVGDRYGIAANGPVPDATVVALLHVPPETKGAPFKRWTLTGGFGTINGAPTDQAYLYARLQNGSYVRAVIDFTGLRGPDLQFDDDDQGNFRAFGTGITGISTSVTRPATWESYLPEISEEDYRVFLENAATLPEVTFFLANTDALPGENTVGAALDGLTPDTAALTAGSVISTDDGITVAATGLDPDAAIDQIAKLATTAGTADNDDKADAPVDGTDANPTEDPNPPHAN